jgi:hypothetical protein
MVRLVLEAITLLKLKYYHHHHYGNDSNKNRDSKDAQ